MRTETDEFYDRFKDHIMAESLNDNIYVNSSAKTVEMTKQQAAEFARQILEMCGEGEK